MVLCYCRISDVVGGNLETLLSNRRYMYEFDETLLMLSNRYHEVKEKL